MMRRARPASPRLGLEALRLVLAHRPFLPAMWTPLLAQDCHVRVGNARPAVCRDKALAALGLLLDRTTGVGATFWDARRAGIACYVETDVQYLDARGCACELPCTVIIRPCDPPFRDLRFYLDPGPIPRPMLSA